MTWAVMPRPRQIETGHGPDAVRVHQGGPARGDQFGELLVQGPGLLVDGLELGDQLAGNGESVVSRRVSLVAATVSP
jgi:hypothetical protein